MPNRIDKTDTKTAIVGGMAVIIAVLLVAVLWFWQDSKKPNPQPSTAKIEEIYKKARDPAKDIGAEIPQAAKDALTRGDQTTTRPNEDNSTKKLDQK